MFPFNFRFNLKQMLTFAVIVVLVLVFLGYQQFGLSRILKRIKNMVFAGLETVHVIRVDNPAPKAPREENNASPEEEQWLPDYQRTEYEPYLPNVYLDPGPSPRKQKAMQDVAESFGEFAQAQASPFLERRDLVFAALRGQRLSDQQRARIEKDLDRADRFMTKLRFSAVNDRLSTDYLRQALSDNQIQAEEVDLIREGVILFCLDAINEVEKGQPERALNAIAAAGKIGMFRPITSLQDQEEQVDYLKNTVKIWERVIGETDSGRIIENSITDLNSLRFELHRRTKEVKDPVSRDILARIGKAAGEKKIRALDSSSPVYLFEQYMDVLQKEAGLKQTDGDASTTRTVSSIEGEIKELQQEVKRSIEARKAHKAMGGDIVTSLGLHPQNARERVLEAEVDLLRLAAAEKAFRKNNEGKLPEDDSDLTSRYLSFYPLDPFGKGHVKWLQDEGLFYSVGPDGVDNGGRILYDPTNGTISGGDIVRRTFSSPAAEK
ncbi:MAG: hypothetical protein ACOC54_03940 [Candidatus Sumerlaeota bacterium]